MGVFVIRVDAERWERTSRSRVDAALVPILADAAVVLSTRLLVPSYNGPCVTIRRGIDNAERALGFGMDEVPRAQAWLAGGDGWCTRWHDQSPAARDASQAAAASQPRAAQGGALVYMGDRLALRFGQSLTTALAGAGYSPLSTAEPMTMAAVLQMTGAPLGHWPVIFGNAQAGTLNGGASLGCRALTSELRTFRTGRADSGFASNPTPAWGRRMAVVWECPTGLSGGSVSSTLTINNGPRLAGSLWGYGPQSEGYLVGGGGHAGNPSINGWIAEVIVWRRVLTDAERAAVWASQQAYFEVSP